MTESKTKRFLKHTSIYAIGNIARQVTGFIMLPIYTRFLTPEDYGVIALLSISLFIVEVILGARLGEAIPKFYHEEKKADDKSLMVSTAWILTTVASAITCLVLIIFSEDISMQLFETKEHTLAVSLVLISLITTGMESYGLIYLRIKERPVFFVSASIFKMILQMVMSIVLLVVYDMAVLGVIVSNVTATFLVGFGLSLFLLYETKIKFSIQKAKKLLAFSWPLWVSGIAGLYIYSASRFFMSNFVSLEAVGFYDLAAKFTQIILVLVWAPVFQFWQVERYKYYKENEKAPDIFRDFHKTLCVILTLSALAVILFSKTIIYIMSDEAFHGSYKGVIWITISGLFYCMTEFIYFSFLATSNTKIIRNLNYVTCVFLTLICFLLIPKFGFIGAAITALLTRSFHFFIVYKKSTKIYDMRLDIKFMLSLFFIVSVVSILADAVVIEGLLYETIFRLIVFIMALLITLLMIRKDKALTSLFMKIVDNISFLSKFNIDKFIKKALNA